MEIVPMDSIRTRANVPQPGEWLFGVVSREGTKENSFASPVLTQPGLPKSSIHEVASVTNAITLHRFSKPWNYHLKQQWCVQPPKLFSFVDRVLDLHKVTLKAFIFESESSVAKSANSLPCSNTGIAS